MPKAAEPWSLTSLREKLIKIGAKVVSHGRYVTFQMAEVAVSRQMFADILSLIARLRAPPPLMLVPADQMRDATTGKVRLDAGEAARFSASAQSIGPFDRLVRPRGAVYRCRRRPKGRFWLTTNGNPGNIGLHNPLDYG